MGKYGRIHSEFSSQGLIQDQQIMNLHPSQPTKEANICFQDVIENAVVESLRCLREDKIVSIQT